MSEHTVAGGGGGEGGRGQKQDITRHFISGFTSLAVDFYLEVPHWCLTAFVDLLHSSFGHTMHKVCIFSYV